MQTCRRNKLRDGYIRLVVTRGVGSLGLNPYTCKRPSVIIIADKIQLYPEEYYRRGLDIITVPTTRNLHSALESGHQVAQLPQQHPGQNRGEQRRLRRGRSCSMPKGFVAECTGDNIFIVKGGHLLTPPLSAGALYGITRGVVMELARENGLTVSEPNLTRYDLFNADECFLTGTGAEIIAAVKIDGRIIGSGKPGPVTGEAGPAVSRVNQSLRRADIDGRMKAWIFILNLNDLW